MWLEVKVKQKLEAFGWLYGKKRSDAQREVIDCHLKNSEDTGFAVAEEHLCRKY